MKSTVPIPNLKVTLINGESHLYFMPIYSYVEKCKNGHFQGDEEVVLDRFEGILNDNEFACVDEFHSIYVPKSSILKIEIQSNEFVLCFDEESNDYSIAHV